MKTSIDGISDTGCSLKAMQKDHIDLLVPFNGMHRFLPAVFTHARLKISEVLPNNFQADSIFPGMPVETFIETEDRTFLQYLVKPFTDSFNRAFREG